MQRAKLQVRLIVAAVLRRVDGAARDAVALRADRAEELVQVGGERLARVALVGKHTPAAAVGLLAVERGRAGRRLRARHAELVVLVELVGREQLTHLALLQVLVAQRLRALHLPSAHVLQCLSSEAVPTQQRQSLCYYAVIGWSEEEYVRVQNELRVQELVVDSR